MTNQLPKIYKFANVVEKNGIPFAEFRRPPANFFERFLEISILETVRLDQREVEDLLANWKLSVRHHHSSAGASHGYAYSWTTDNRDEKKNLETAHAAILAWPELPKSKTAASEVKIAREVKSTHDNPLLISGWPSLVPGDLGGNALQDAADNIKAVWRWATSATWKTSAISSSESAFDSGRTYSAVNVSSFNAPIDEGSFAARGRTLISTIKAIRRFAVEAFSKKPAAQEPPARETEKTLDTKTSISEPVLPTTQSDLVDKRLLERYVLLHGQAIGENNRLREQKDKLLLITYLISASTGVGGLAVGLFIGDYGNADIGIRFTPDNDTAEVSRDLGLLTQDRLFKSCETNVRDWFAGKHGVANFEVPITPEIQSWLRGNSARPSVAIPK